MQNVPFINLEYLVTQALNYILGQHDYLPKVMFVYYYLEVFALLFSLICIAGIIYSKKKLNELERKAAKKDQEREQKIALGKMDPRWVEILRHINSENSNDWRQAIMEADIMLEELLERQGVHGDTIGEKLKSLTKDDFRSLDFAWEAHRIRNTIAHEGSSFQISAREAKRVIALFQQVFKEFKVI